MKPIQFHATFGDERLVVTIRRRLHAWSNNGNFWDQGYFEVKAGDEIQGYLEKEGHEWRLYHWKGIGNLTTYDIHLLGRRIDNAFITMQRFGGR